MLTIVGAETRLDDAASQVEGMRHYSRTEDATGLVETVVY